MTTEQRKEDLRDEFYDKFCYSQEGQFRGHTDPFDFFWAEIEAREKASTKLREDALLVCQRLRFNDNELLQAKIKSLEEIIKAADEVIKCYPKKGLSEKYGYDHEQALEKYNKLKSKT